MSTPFVQSAANIFLAPGSRSVQYCAPMNLERIRALLNAPKLNIDEEAKRMGLSRRTLYYIKGGAEEINLATYRKLEVWAKGRRLPSDAKEANDA